MTSSTICLGSPDISTLFGVDHCILQGCKSHPSTTTSSHWKCVKSVSRESVLISVSSPLKFVSQSFVSDSLWPYGLCDSSVHGILQVRMLEWVAISFSRDLPQPGIEPVSSVPLALAGRFFTTELPGKPATVLLLLLLSRFSCVRLCVTPEMAAHQAPLSLGFSRQEYWSGLPLY